jgi:conjugative transposon TraM protein
MKVSTEKLKRQKALYLMLPVLFAPFIVLLFWALGGGKGVYAKEPEEKSGLNTQLPNAKLPDNSKGWDKLSLYQQAQKDSLRKAEAERTDPYFRLKTITEIQDRDSLGFVNHSLGEKDYALDSSEAVINQKIAAINNVISTPKTYEQKAVQSANVSNKPTDNGSEEIDRLEEMMVMMQTDGGGDPEMAQIENVLEKILDVQHPERVREKLQDESAKTPGKTYSVVPIKSSVTAKFFGDKQDKKESANSFISLNETNPQDQGNIIQAVISYRQTLQAGATVKIKILDDVYLNGKLIPQGSFVFGECELQNDRLLINVKSILIRNSIFTVNLAAFDLDGQEGIFIPGSVANDASKQATNNAMQDLQLLSADPSIGAQAASAGIQTAKTLIGKKTRTVKVQVESGYKLFLKDKNSKTN